MATLLTFFQMRVARPQICVRFHKIVTPQGTFLVGMIGNKPPSKQLQALGFSRNTASVVIIVRIMKVVDGTVVSESLRQLRIPGESATPFRADLPPSDLQTYFGVISWPTMSTTAFADVPDGNPPRLPTGNYMVEAQVSVAGYVTVYKAEAVISTTRENMTWIGGKNALTPSTPGR